LSTFGNAWLQNGSKNEPRAPRTSIGCPHKGPSAVCLSTPQFHFTLTSTSKVNSTRKTRKKCRGLELLMGANPQPPHPNPQPPAPTPQPPTHHPQPPTLNPPTPCPQPSTPNPTPHTSHPTPHTPQPQTPHPTPHTPHPTPHTPHLRSKTPSPDSAEPHECSGVEC